MSVISGSSNSVVATIHLGTSDPYEGVFDPSNGDIYINDPGLNEVTVISGSTDSLVSTIPVGQQPWSPMYDPANGDIYVPNLGDNLNNGAGSLSVISGATNSVVATITFGVDPGVTTVSTPVFDPLTHDLYMTGGDGASGPDTNVSVVSSLTNAVVSTTTLTGWPETPAVDASNGEVYVACYRSWSSQPFAATVTALSGANGTPRWNSPSLEAGRRAH